MIIITLYHDLVYQNDLLLTKIFPYKLSYSLIPTEAVEWLRKNFGHDCLSIDTKDSITFLLKEDQRWDRWHGNLYFKNEEDAIFIKLKFG